MKVMIAYPPLPHAHGIPQLSQNRQFQWFNNPTYIYPVIPATAATLLMANGHDVLWKDAIAEGLSSADFRGYVLEATPDVLVMETKTPVIKKHWALIRELKELLPRTRFALMGDHVTALPEESMRQCPSLDFIITGGDYDLSLLGLAGHLQDGEGLPSGIWHRSGNRIVSTGDFQLTEDLDALPLIDRRFTRFDLYREYNIKRWPYAYTMAGRDCPYHRCRFCGWTTLFPSFRVRSPENLLDEIGMLITQYDVKEIFDDTGTFPTGDWLDVFCQGMVERGYSRKVTISCNFRFDYMLDLARLKLMKQAGFRLVKAGLESANQRTLDRLDKGIKVEDISRGCAIAHEAGLETHLTIMVGYPWETREDAQNTVKLAKHLMTSGLAEVLQATVVIPYPGTPLYEECKDNDWFSIDPTDYDRFDMSEPVLKTPDMSPEEVMDVCNSIYRGVFLSPKYVMRRFTKIRSPSDLKYHLRGAKAVIGHMRDFRRLRGKRHVS